ncbi:MAG: PIN domain-containing protein [Pseudomonadota bacterium]
MTAADSSVWIDLLNGKRTLQTDILYGELEHDRVAIHDLVKVEILLGYDDDREHEAVKQRLTAFETITTTSEALITETVNNYRELRRRGVTIRKTVDTLIASECIFSRRPLLFNDRDFFPFVTYFGLRNAADLTYTDHTPR